MKLGWKTVKLGDFVDFVGGGTPDKKNPDYWNGDIKWASVKDVKNKYLHTTQDTITELGLKNSSSQLAKDGELILVTRISPGKCVIAKDNIAINQDLKIARLKADVSTNFVYYFFTAKENEFIKRSSGTTVKGIRLEEIRIIEINLPPLLEQRAIVSKIELLFSELDNGIANLKLAQAQLKVYRQAVLKKAFEGELTRKWREQQIDLPDAGDLLELIRKEREEAAKISGKKQKSVLRLTEDELIELPRTPDGWRWTKIGQVSKVGTGVTPLKKRRDFYESGTIPWVTSGALNESYVNLASDYVTEIALKETSLKIYPKHTLLVALYGEGKTRGKCSELLIEATTNQAIAAIVQEGTEEEIRPYLKWFLMKNYNEIRMKSSGGVQPNLNLGIIENTGFPICSLPEQQAIIQEIETRLSVCDKIEQDIKENLEKVEALRQSILKKAFEGKLLNERELVEIRGAEDWEPAEVLLDRIRVEKAKK